MYQPPHSKVDDVTEMHALMRARPFATFISSGNLGLFATQLPTILKPEGATSVIECHVARANPHWKDLAVATEALMIFHGPDGYVTPGWYPSKAETGKVVPTWNYVAVHAYGQPVMMDETDWKRRHVADLTAQQERDQPRPWELSDAPESFIQTMLRGFVGFRFEIARLEGKWKMSQNRDARDRQGVETGLRVRGSADDIAMAELVADGPSGKPRA